MKNMFSRIITAFLCAAMVCTLPAFAAEVQPAQPEVGSPQPYPMAPVRVWGRVTKLDSGGLLVQNSNENDPYHEIILHGESIRILDAVTGLPLDRDLRDGEVIYAWVGPAMTMSLPPHATARIIVAGRRRTPVLSGGKGARPGRRAGARGAGDHGRHAGVLHPARAGHGPHPHRRKGTHRPVPQ